jgi:hypothetical protein
MESIPASSPLCSTCCQINLSSLYTAPLPKQAGLYLQLKSVNVSSECPICKLILETISPFLNRHTTSPPIQLRIQVDEEETSVLTITSIKTRDDNLTNLSIRLCRIATNRGIPRSVRRTRRCRYIHKDIQLISATTDTLPAAYIPGRVVGRPRSSKTISTILSWLTYCDEHHMAGECPASRQQTAESEVPLLPSRVIDVGLSEYSPPRLILSNGRRGRYATMVHRWGGFSGILTTKSTVHEYEAALPMVDLPRTFQDAIILTRKLGIQYLWIDILTIVQDDDEEWIREAAAFGKTFCNAYLTIAATSAADASAGLWYAAWSRNQHIKLDWNPNRSERACVYMTAYEPFSFDVLDASPLYTRAWVMQERILPRRLLHIGPDQVYWQCDEVFCAENGLRRFDKSIRSQLLPFWIDEKRFSRNPTLSIATLTPEEIEDQLCSAWTQLITAYTRCSISFSEDRLPGLANIASKIHAKTGITYLLGHWFGGGDSTICSLLWYASGPAFTRPPLECRPSRTVMPTKIVTPSWSWSSLDGHQSFIMHAMADNKSAAHDGFSPLASVKQVQDPLQVGKALHVPLILNGYARSATCAFSMLDGTGISQRCYTILLDGITAGWACFDTDDEPPETFFCLQMCAAKTKALVHSIDLTCVVLLLRRNRVGLPEEYLERIGIGSVSNASWFVACDRDDVRVV